MSNLDAVLRDWHEAHAAGCKQVDRQRVLGFPPSALPSRPALAYATLAALGAHERLEALVRQDVDTLRAKGVIDPNVRLSDLNVGVLAAIESVRPHLRHVLDLVEAMTIRALAAPAERSHEHAPVLRVPSELRAAVGQTACIEVKCAETDRLLIHAPSLGLTRVIIQPEALQLLNLTIFAGDLIVYAENDSGCCKVVQPIEIGRLARGGSVGRLFARAAFGRRSSQRGESQSSLASQGKRESA